MYKFNQTDLLILGKIQEWTRIPWTPTELARQLDSPHPQYRGSKIAEDTVQRAIKALEEEDIIKRHTVELDAKKLGLDYLALISVTFLDNERSRWETFLEKVAELP